MYPYRKMSLLKMALWMVASLALSSGCGDEEETGRMDSYLYPDFFPWTDSSAACSALSCSGCCLSTTCLGGTSDAACGYGGSDCKTCSSTEKCQAGVCTVSKCDSTTCSSGCCDSSGACQNGTSSSACGTGGATCKSCSSSEACVSGSCTSKGPAMYKVILVSVKVTGASWIVCGFAELSECDLYVILKVGSTTVQSTIKANTNSPTWNEYMLTQTDTELIKSFDVEVRDDDPIGSVQIGKCKPSISTTTLSAGQLVSDCGDAKQMTFTFSKI